jgi:hypothetical protein
LNIFGIVCCGSRLIGLNDDPYIYRPKLRIHLKPGTHEMYLTTHRVFPWDVTASVYEPSEWETASNMLKVRVEPDPGWQERELARVNAKPGDPSNCGALSVLDIPAATAEKLEIIRSGKPCEWRYAFNETEYSRALKGMEQIIRSPTYGVVWRDVNLTLGVRNWLAHPELRHIPTDKAAYERWREIQRPASVISGKDFIRELCALLPTKIADAREVTQKAIDGLTAYEDYRGSRCGNPSN